MCYQSDWCLGLWRWPGVIAQTMGGSVWPIIGYVRNTGRMMAIIGAGLDAIREWYHCEDKNPQITKKLMGCWPPILPSTLLYPRPTKLEGGYTGFTLSVCPSVCRRHGFRSISQVCFGISISNFICMLMVAIGRSLLIFSDVTFKMAAWRPYWIFWFPDSNFTLALNINFKLQRDNTYVYG